MIDTHAHLNFPDFKDDRPEVLTRAEQSGVKYIINVGTSLETSRQSVELSRRYKNIYATVGIHPHDAENVKESDWSEFEKLVEQDKVVAVGEIGLDFYKKISPPRSGGVQEKVFIKQLEIALRKNKPVVIHSREAHQKCL
ncbi:MAG: TatD family hydrolase, partial [Planctomycetota bacterium]